MAVALPSSGVVVSHCHPPSFSSSSACGKNRKGFGTSSSSSSSKKSKKITFKGDDNGGGEEEDDPYEALFNLLEEDLKNDKSTIDGEDRSEEDLDALAEELALALGGGDDVDSIDLFGSATGDVVDDEDDDDSEEDERPTKLKNWQLRRLAYALKAGRSKTTEDQNDPLIFRVTNLPRNTEVV